MCMQPTIMCDCVRASSRDGMEAGLFRKQPTLAVTVSVLAARTAWRLG